MVFLVFTQKNNFLLFSADFQLIFDNSNVKFADNLKKVELVESLPPFNQIQLLFAQSAAI